MDEAKLLSFGASQQLKCHLCGNASTIICDACSRLTFCIDCDGLFHSHPRRNHHARAKIGSECLDRNMSPRLEGQGSLRLDNRSTANRTKGNVTWQDTQLHHRALTSCQQNENSAKGGLAINGATWVCEHCTFVNGAGTRICKMCCKTHGVPRDERWKGAVKGSEANQKVEQWRDVTYNRRRLPGKLPPLPKSDVGIPTAKKWPEVGAEKNVASGNLADKQKLKNAENAPLGLERCDTNGESARNDNGLQLVLHEKPNSSEVESKINIVTWVCDRCTFENATKTPICAMCERTRDVPSDQRQTKAGEGSKTSQKVNEKKRVADNAEKLHELSPPPPKDVAAKPPEKKPCQDGDEKNSISAVTAGKQRIKVSENDGRNDLSLPSVKQLASKFEDQPENEKSSKVKKSFNNIVAKSSFEAKNNADDRSQSAVATWSPSSHLSQQVHDGLQSVGSARAKKKPAKSCKSQLENWMKEAKEYGFSNADLEVAVNLCETKNPVQWLRDNWQEMVENVVQLATSYGYEGNKNVGILSAEEAKKALHKHLGDRRKACMECVELRTKGVMELQARGNFPLDSILDALSSKEGNVEAAYEEILKKLYNFKDKKK